MGRPVATARQPLSPGCGSAGEWLVAAVFVTAMATGCAYRPHMPVFRTPPTPDTVVQTWLRKNCKAGDDNDLEQYMRQFGVQVTPALIAAFAMGPPEPERQAILSGAESQLYDLQRRLVAARLAPEDAARIRDLSPKVYAQQALDKFIQAYKSSALAGLGVVGTPDAITQLQKEASNAQSEFYVLARVILAHARKPAKR
jgi:hypothetical protein